MTPQEIITKVWEHMAKQRVQAYDAIKGHCAYRTRDGKACAVGCLLDDATAEKLDQLDTLAIRYIVEEHPDIVPEWVVENVYLLEEMQDAHDTRPPLGEDWYTEFKTRVQAIALRYGCEVPGEIA